MLWYFEFGPLCFVTTVSLRIKHQHPAPTLQEAHISNHVPATDIQPNPTFSETKRNGMLYHEKVINAGFRASGNSRCEVVTVAMGRMATKSVIFQS